MRKNKHIKEDIITCNPFAAPKLITVEMSELCILTFLHHWHLWAWSSSDEHACLSICVFVLVVYWRGFPSSWCHPNLHFHFVPFSRWNKNHYIKLPLRYVQLYCIAWNDLLWMLGGRMRKIGGAVTSAPENAKLDGLITFSTMP